MEYRFTEKCIGCYQLRREELDIEMSRIFKDRRKNDEGKLVVYDCLDGLYPYQAAISGLLHPSVGINQAARGCPRVNEGHCILCPETDNLLSYGKEPLVYICKEHDKAWENWLDEVDSYSNVRREYIAPRGQMIRSIWIELFREFIEEIRQQLEGKP